MPDEIEILEPIKADNSEIDTFDLGEILNFGSRCPEIQFEEEGIYLN